MMPELGVRPRTPREALIGSSGKPAPGFGTGCRRLATSCSELPGGINHCAVDRLCVCKGGGNGLMEGWCRAGVVTRYRCGGSTDCARRLERRHCGLFPIELSQHRGRTKRPPSRKHLLAEIYHDKPAAALARGLHMYKMNFVHVVVSARLSSRVHWRLRVVSSLSRGVSRYNGPSIFSR